MIDESLKILIENNALACATVDETGNPHCIAVGFAKVIDNKILITDNYMVQTIKNLQNNPKVALAVWNEDWKNNCQGFELKGTAELFKEGKWFEEIKKIPENKEMPCKTAILVTIDEVKKLA